MNPHLRTQDPVHASGWQPAGPSRRIILAEDDDAMRHLVAESLMRDGYEALRAGSPQANRTRSVRAVPDAHPGPRRLNACEPVSAGPESRV